MYLNSDGKKEGIKRNEGRKGERKGRRRERGGRKWGEMGKRREREEKRNRHLLSN